MEHKPELVRISDLLATWESDATAAHEAYTTGQARGAVTALPRLDRELGGFLTPGVHIVHGAPGAGKTAFALQVAATCGTPAVFVTCEMSPIELLRRITARVTGTFLGRFKTGEFTPEYSLRLASQAVAAVPNLYLADATLAYPNRAWIQEAALAVRGKERHVLVVIDSVHSWADGVPNAGMAEYDALNTSLAELRAISAVLECPVLTVAERNRMSMNKGGLSAGAGTRKLEYGAWTVLDLGRKEGDKADANGEVEVVVTLDKNREGQKGVKVPLMFNGALQSFREDV